MIAKSDLVILLVSVSLLAGGLYRWQQKLPTVGRSATVARLPVTPGAGNRVDGGSARSVAGQVLTGSRTQADTVNGSSTAAGAAIERRGRELDTIAPAAQTGTGRQATSVRPTSSSPGGIDSSTGADAGAGTPLSEPMYGIYIVEPGDYLGKIAQTYGTTVATLRRINGISGSLIEVDQQILYPLPAN